MKVNLVVNDAPFGDGPIISYVDTSSGALVMELGQLDDADVTVTTDYETAKSLFLATDPAAGMQAFMSGKLVVQGDTDEARRAPDARRRRPRRPSRLRGNPRSHRLIDLRRVGFAAEAPAGPPHRWSTGSRSTSDPCVRRPPAPSSAERRGAAATR